MRRSEHIHCDVLYLDADEETLLKRFSETRRRHPLTNTQRSLAEAIRVESRPAGAYRRPGRPQDRHHQPQPVPAARLDQAAPAQPARAWHGVPGGVLRLQAWHAGRRRPGVRCALPAPTPIGSPELRITRGLSNRSSTTWPRSRTSKRCSRTFRRTCSSGYHGSPPATGPMSPSPSAAPAVIIARCIMTERLGQVLQQTLKKRPGSPPRPQLRICRDARNRNQPIINKLGLHARAAAKFVGVAGKLPLLGSYWPYPGVRWSMARASWP